MDTISVTTDAVLMPYQTGTDYGRDNYIHCADMTEGTKVMVEVDGKSAVVAVVKDCSELVPDGTFLALPPNLFGLEDINDHENIEKLLAHGETRHTKVVAQDVAPDDKQLMIDFFMSGVTEKESVNEAS